MSGSAAESRVSVAFTMTARESFLAEVADAPVTTLITLAGALGPGARYRRRIERAVRSLSGLLVTVVADASGLTYQTPDNTVVLPWGVWGTASQRFGVWTVRLAAQPTSKISIPVSALDADENALLRAMFAEHGLLRARQR